MYVCMYVYTCMCMYLHVSVEMYVFEDSKLSFHKHDGLKVTRIYIQEAQACVAAMALSSRVLALLRQF